MSMARSLASHFGSAECSLLPCPGWDADALFPSPTLRVEGSWSVGAVAWAAGAGICRRKAFLRLPPFAAPRPKALPPTVRPGAACMHCPDR